MALYYVIVFNRYFDGIDGLMLRESLFIKKILRNVMLIAIIFGIGTILNTQNILFGKIATIENTATTRFDGVSSNIELTGASYTDTTIKRWGYTIYGIVIIICVGIAIKYFKQKNTQKVLKSLAIIPIYLVCLFVVMIGFNLIFVTPNKLDKEKENISNNIESTKNAYGIDVNENSLEYSGTITEQEVKNNDKIINNIPLVSKESILATVKEKQTGTGYYTYRQANLAKYKIDERDQLVYVSPREIVNSGRTYTNKTYEYTHGFGAIITSATSTTDSGNINHIQKAFDQTDEVLNINEPRIYFGLETNDTVVTNSNSKKEFDYPTEDALKNTENVYDGDAGLKANFLDRLVLAIREKDAKLVFSGNVKSDSKILTNRNIIQRAKTIMPYLTYDDDPYMVVTNDGELVWVLDAYATSNEYPYSQRTVLEENGISKDEINYIRNSVKVIIDAYTGDVTFYRTDKTDPIAMVYEKIYPDLFSKEEIPEQISDHFVYPEYLYNIQAKVLKRYHNIQPDVLYRGDDVWDIATHNASSKVSSTKGTEINPYYTMVKTTDSTTSRLGLVIPFTPYEKQNVTAYLVGSTDENGNNVLKLYNYPTDSNVLGPMQLDTQLGQDETIAKEIENLNVSGTKLSKDIIIVPINNTLLYVEPIYQQFVNETDSLPVLKKVVVASGNKVAIGNTFSEALSNLVSQYAVDIEIENTDSLDELADLIIKANNNLKTSTQSNDWEQIGKDTKRLQNLINRLEEVKKEIDKKSRENGKNNTTAINELVDENVTNVTE